MTLELNPIVQRISTNYNSSGLTSFIKDLTSAKGVAILFAAGVGAVAGAIVTCVNTTMAWGKSLDDTMKLLGLTSKEAAGLNLMAKVTGVSIDTLTRGLDIMGKGLVTVDGKLGATGKELKAIGIDVYSANGEMKKTPDILAEVADYMSKMKDGTEKTALEMKIFGRSGAEMDEILRQAAGGGMQKYIDQAGKMGLALTPAQVDQVHNLGMNMNMLKEQFEGIAVVLGIAFIPMMQSATTWIGNLVGSLLPAITNFGMFLSLLMGGTGTAITAQVMTPGSLGSEENQWRVKHGFVPNARYGAMPTADTYTTGGGGPGGEGVSVVIQPWMQAILDLKAGLLKFDWQLLADNIKTMAGWVNDILTWARGITIGGKGIWADQSGTAQGKNLSSVQMGIAGGWTFDANAWFDKAVLQPIKDWLSGSGTSYSLGTSITGWWYDEVTQPLEEWYRGVNATLYIFGMNIGQGIQGMIDVLGGYYNTAIAWIAKILGITLPGYVPPPKPGASQSSTVGTKNLRASGGWLADWTVVGEQGFEIIDPHGYVHPHGESIKMLPMLGNVRQLGFGGGVGGSDVGWGGGGGATGGSGTSHYGKTSSSGNAPYIPNQPGAGSGGAPNYSSSEASAAAQAVSEAVTPAVAVVAQSGVAMAKASAQATAAQIAAQAVNVSTLEEMKGLRRDLKAQGMIIVAEIQKAMAA